MKKILITVMTVFLLSIAGISSVVTADRIPEENDDPVDYEQILLLANRALKAVKDEQANRAIRIIEGIIDSLNAKLKILQEEMIILHEEMVILQEKLMTLLGLLDNCDPDDHEQIEYLQTQIQELKLEIQNLQMKICDLDMEMNLVMMLIMEFDMAKNALFIPDFNDAEMHLKKAIEICLTLI